jgi:predicted permease
MPWAILLGTAASALHVGLWEPANKLISLLGNAASPVALFTIGAILARGSGSENSAASQDYWLLALLKLLLHPALVWSTGTVAIRFGLPLSPFALTVITLVAALPSASNVTLLTERLHADTARVARVILISTSLAFVTFSSAVVILPRPPM